MYDKCRRYAVDWNIILQNTSIDSLEPNESWPLQHCDKGWEYNKTDVQSSIVIDVREEKIERKKKKIANWKFVFHSRKHIFPLCKTAKKKEKIKIWSEREKFNFHFNFFFIFFFLFFCSAHSHTV